MLCCRSTTACSLAAHHPASDPLVASPVSATPRDLPVAPGRRRGLAKRKFKAYPIGYFHIDIAEVRTAQGKLSLIVAIDRTSKFAVVGIHEKVARRTAGDFLRRLTAAVPYKVHTVLTDNGTHFPTPGHTSSAAPDIKGALEAGELVWAHAFEYPPRTTNTGYPICVMVDKRSPAREGRRGANERLWSGGLGSAPVETLTGAIPLCPPLIRS